VVEFRLVESLTSTTSTEPITNVVHRERTTHQCHFWYLIPIPVELTNKSKTTEILWNFIRCVGDRLTLAKNPHFYRRLPTSPTATSNDFPDPIESDWHEHPIYVLSNIPGRIFLECGRGPKQQWAFDNVWDINGTLIFRRQFF
jgi:hypothetical protein